MTHRGFLPLMNGDRQFQFVKLESSFDFFSKKNSTKAYSTYWAISIEWVWHDQIHSLVVLKKGTIHLRSSLKSRQWPNSLSSILTNLQTANLTFLNVWNLWTRNSLTPVQEVHIFLIEKNNLINLRRGSLKRSKTKRIRRKRSHNIGLRYVLCQILGRSSLNLTV